MSVKLAMSHRNSTNSNEKQGEVNVESVLVKSPANSPLLKPSLSAVSAVSPGSIDHDSSLSANSNTTVNTHKKRVAFDTVNNKLASDFSLTLRWKYENYEYSRLTRTILIAADTSKYSKAALEWLFEELVCDGDEVVCLRVVDPNDKIVDEQLNRDKLYREEAEAFLEGLTALNVHKHDISLVLEYSVGKVQEMIRLMIRIYEPSIFVVGTRGRTMDGFKGLLPGSVSKYCLQHSPIPVIVVKQSQKREKRKAKRDADPSRRHYREALLSAADSPSNIKYYSEGSSPNKVKPKLPYFLQYPTSTERSRSPLRGAFSSVRSSSRSASRSRDRTIALKNELRDYESEPNLATARLR